MPGVVLHPGHTATDKTDESLPLQIWTPTGYLSIIRKKFLDIITVCGHVLKGVLGEKKKRSSWASLVVQRLRIHLSMQGVWVWSLVQEDPACCGATKLVCHTYWVCALEPTSRNSWAHVLQTLKPACPRACLFSATREATAMRSPCTATSDNNDPVQQKIN